MLWTESDVSPAASCLIVVQWSVNSRKPSMHGRCLRFGILMKVLYILDTLLSTEPSAASVVSQSRIYKQQQT